MYTREDQTERGVGEKTFLLNCIGIIFFFPLKLKFVEEKSLMCDMMDGKKKIKQTPPAPLRLELSLFHPIRDARGVVFLGG